MQSSGENWQEIAWDGLCFKLPQKWVPTVVDKSYLLFEDAGRPVFAIKWNTIRGRFNAQNIIKKLQRSSQRSTVRISPWKVPDQLLRLTGEMTIAGFQSQDDQGKSLGLLLFCPQCNRSTMLQFYEPGHDVYNLCRILESLTDHPQGNKQKWTIYDILAILPTQAKLLSHEFLAGRYTLSFTLPEAEITLYRFKPAAAILKNQSLVEFAAPFAECAVCIDNNEGSAQWEYSASGLDRLAAIAMRRPRWIWMQVIHDADHNALIAVKGKGQRIIDRELLLNIAKEFNVTDSVN